MRKWSTALALFVVAWMACPVGAFAQPEDPLTGKPLGEGEISINLNVNYRLAYRDSTWVPVDVFVDNNTNDINGFVEVRTYCGDTMQSPVYRVSAQCPKSSRKRFRLHCFMKQTTRVETMVYDNNRPIQTVWPWLDISPVKTEDLLGLVLDDNPTDYSFLNMTLYTGNEDQRRFFREDLNNARIGMLADYAQCYTPYDVIILGAIEAERIQERHRGLISRYVREGGTLIVCTGENAPNYRHTWVEELTGVSVGTTRAISEGELATAVFSGGDLEGLKPVQKDVQIADLKMIAPDVTVWSSGGTGGVVLAARRTLGRGQVVTLAVDAASKVLQDSVGFKRLWRSLCTYRRDRGDLNFQAANAMYSEQLPYVCGIQLYSKASVMMYLFLYFAIGIVANWIVFSWLKRRELAWLVLVVCAVGFTGYAMVFGTAGRAKASRLDQLEVLRIPRSGVTPGAAVPAVEPGGGGLAAVRSTVSLITARTTRQAFKLSREYSLAEDFNVIDMNFGYPRRPDYGERQNRIFYLQEDIPSRIDQFVVGASELRLTQVLADVPVSGGFEGTLESDPDRLRGTLVNTTGMAIERPSIWYDNQMYSARVEGNKIHIEDQSPHSLVIDQNQRGGGMYNYVPNRSSTQTTPEADQFKRRNLYDRYLNTLFLSNEELSLNNQFPQMPSSQGSARRPPGGISMPPLLVAWAKTGPMGTVDPDIAIAEKGGATIIVADIDVHRNGGVRRIWDDATVTITDSVSVTGGQSLPTGPQNIRPSFQYQNAYQFTRDNGPDVEIVIPPEMLKRNPGNLVITLTSGNPYSIEFRPKDKGPEWATTHVATDSQGNRDRRYYNSNMRRQTYDLSDWQSYTDATTGKLSGKLFLEPGTPFSGPINAGITARVLVDELVNKSEDWKPWQ